MSVQHLLSHRGHWDGPPSQDPGSLGAKAGEETLEKWYPTDVLPGVWMSAAEGTWAVPEVTVRGGMIYLVEDRAELKLLRAFKSLAPSCLLSRHGKEDFLEKGLAPPLRTLVSQHPLIHADFIRG